MQGKKDYQEKLFANFQLSQRVREHNFYRRLSEVLDLVKASLVLFFDLFRVQKMLCMIIKI